MKSFDSPEWRLGQAAERLVRAHFTAQGWFVVPMYAIQDGGAPKVIGQLRSHVLPDLQKFRDGEIRWVEVKAKTCPVWFQKSGRYRHGIDLPHWHDYVRVESESGLPGYLAIVQITNGRDEPPNPTLLYAPFAVLQRHVQFYETPTPSAPRGMAYFDVDLFDGFANIPTDPAGVRLMPLPPRIVHPWERHRRLGVRQLPLDSEGW